MTTQIKPTPLNILSYPHEVLSKKCEDIDITGPRKDEYVKFIIQMLELYNEGGEWGHMVGIAAPQVGKNWNVFIALGDVFINPILEVDELIGYSLLKEGCYSLDKDRFDYPVKRAFKVLLRWQDIEGKSHRKKFMGREAQVIQHEMDHLQGRLCVDGGIK